MVVSARAIRPGKLRGAGVAIFQPYVDKLAKKSYIQRQRTV